MSEVARSLDESPKSSYTTAMQPASRKSLDALPQMASLIWIAALFAIAYAQSPLFTSNQNQYFLHGLARAGYGSLDQDWLANTADPTPLFSTLVEYTARLTSWFPIFYLYYAVLLGIYIASLMSIAARLFNLDSHPLGKLSLFTVLVFIHSAGWRFALSRGLGINWTYVLEDGVADQRLLGPVFQPSAFGVLLLLAIALFLRRRLAWAVACLVLAASLHPTYLLSAALLTAVFLGLWVVERRAWKQALLLAILALLGVAPILANTAAAFGGDPALAAAARHLLVAARIPHHAVVAQWLDATAAVKLILVAAALGILWRRAAPAAPGGDHRPGETRWLAWILTAAVFTALSLTLAQVITRSDALALIFPWRISTWVVPLSVTITLAAGLTGLLQQPALQNASIRPVLASLCILAVFLSVLVGGVRFKLDLERKAAQPERRVESFVRQRLEPGQVYLTPVKLQDFRLETGAPVYIDFKSIPYQAADVLEWRRRERLADGFFKFPGCDQLEMFAAQEGITHAVLPAEEPLSCSSVAVIYQDDSYRVLDLRSK